MSIYYHCDICGKSFKSIQYVYGVDEHIDLKVIPGCYYGADDTFSKRELCQECLSEYLTRLGKKLKEKCNDRN